MEPLVSLDRDNILHILDELPRQIRMTGEEQASRLPCTIYIGGGSSLVLRELRMTTSDLDIYVTDKDDNVWNICQEMPGIIERTSAELGYFSDSHGQIPYNFHDRDAPQQWESTQTKEMQSYFFDSAAASISTSEKTAWLAKREFVLMQKLNILMDYGHYSFRQETGKIEQDKIDARCLCECLEIKSADDLDKSIRTLIIDTQERHPTFIERFANTIHSTIQNGGDLKNAWLLIQGDSNGKPPENTFDAPQRGGPKKFWAVYCAQM